ncbi:DUF6686 family protein [Spirosoma pomorum]
MNNACQILATSLRGRITQYVPAHTHPISFQFNNITQWLPHEDLLHLEWVVRHIDINTYFQQYADEERIHLKTSSPHLFFSFSPDELAELRGLLGNAVVQLHWRENLSKSVN